MDNYKKGKDFGGGKRFDGDRGGRRGGFGGGDRSGGRGFGGSRDRSNDRGRFGGGRHKDSRPDMHKAVCTECGNNCEVPFRPTGEKPIFCSDCFKDKGNSNSRNSRDGGRNRGFGDRNSKPRFNDQRQRQGGGEDTVNYKAQFEALNAKLDTLIGILAPTFIKEEVKDIVELKSKKDDESIKKEVDKAPLKKAITKTIDKKPDLKKKILAKKTVTKKKKK